MAKVISANDVQAGVIKPSDTSEPIGTETSTSKLLIARHYSISSKVNLEFIYDNEETKEITVAIGDEVKVKYTDDSGKLREVVGTITDIRNKEMAESFKSNTSMGNGNYILQFKIDASEEFGSNVLTVYLINIYDIEPADIDPGEDPVVEPISWKEDAPITIENGLLTIPYNRAEPGRVYLVISQGEDSAVFFEEFEADSANENASFTWSLRDFSSLNNTSIEGLTYDNDGNYIYHNGDNQIEEVHAIDVDDSKIIPAGTALNIEISHFNEVGSESKIAKVYTVTEEDVAAVKSGTPVTPEDPDEPVTNTYTVTSTVENGTVDNALLTVNEGEEATVTFTPNEGFDKVEVSINGEPVDPGFTDNILTILIPSVTENKTINVVFSKTEVEDPEEPETPVTYTVTSTVENGTVDNESLTVNENESATVVFTSSEGFDLVSATINGVDTPVSIVDGVVTIVIDSVTENKTVNVVFSKTVVPPTTYTITGNAENGTVDNLPQTINEGEDATIVFTPNEGFDLVSATINDVEESVSIVDGKVTITITNVTENKAVNVVFSKTVVPPTTYTVTSTVENGTVDNDSLTVNENESATLVFTPDEGFDLVNATINEVDTPVSIVDGKVTIVIDSITENKTVNVVFSKTVVEEPEPISVTSSIENGIATINVENTSSEDIDANISIFTGESTVTSTSETISAESNKDITWNLRSVSAGTEEEIYYANNRNDSIISEGEYTYKVSYGEGKEITGTITVTADDVAAATHDAIWKFGEVISTSSDSKLMTISYERLVPGDVELVVKANDNVVFREEHSFSTTNANASFTWTMRDFSSLNNTAIEGLTYDKDGNYIYHNGDNQKSEVYAVDVDNSKIIPAGTVLDITITRGNSVLTKQYTVTEEDVAAVTR